MHHFRILSVFFVLLGLVGCDSSAKHPVSGVEIFPPISLEQAALSRVDALPVTTTFFRDQWTWVGFGTAECGTSCRERLALIDGQASAQALFTLMGIAGHRTLRDLGKKYGNTAVAMGTTAASIDGFYTQFDGAGRISEQSLRMLYLVNPGLEVVYKVDTAVAAELNLDRELKAAMALEEG